jgi:pyruvate formate lyase activating enzyme
MKPCRAPQGKDGRGRVHSFESLGTHEGPGIRYVIFMQGCLARCVYCQNPDTWALNEGALISAKEVFQKIDKCLPYIRASNGGVTVSGGEPLLQPEFLIDLFKLCKKRAVHTAIDTSGFLDSPAAGNKKINSLVKLTDLFLVDLKAARPQLHRKLTSRDLKEALDFINMLESSRKPYWIRYVLVPGANSSRPDMEALKNRVAGLKFCEKIELLPYHTLGRHKWQHLGLKYPLEKIRPATAKDIEKAEAVLVNY